MSWKRVLIATLAGLGTGFVCIWGLSSRAPYLGEWDLAGVVASRAVAGLAIGLSSWRAPWWLHGIALGAVFGLPVAIPRAADGAGGVLTMMAASAVFGFLVELTTTVVFRQRQPEAK